MNAFGPKVRLLHMPAIEVCAALVWEVWENAKTLSLSRNIQQVLEAVPHDQLMKRFVDVMSQDLPVAEFVVFVWSVEDAPRAFVDQLDRHRRAAFWEQSFRVLDLSRFAQDGHYYVPDYVRGDPKLEIVYHTAMRQAEDTYNALMAGGAPSEEARGVIPLHTNIRASCCISWRHFRAMVASRSCFISQGQYWRPVIAGFIRELQRAGWPEPLLEQLRGLPCDGTGTCPIEANVRLRLTSEDLNPLCPVFLNLLPVAERPQARAVMDRRFGTAGYDRITQEYQEFLGGRVLLPRCMAPPS